MGAQRQSRCQKIHLAGFGVFMLAALAAAAAWPLAVAAQSPGQSDDPIRVGDHWTFDTKDEITGNPIETYTHVVTEISPNEIVVSSSVRAKTGSSLVVYDHDWNRIENSTFKYTPKDGQGIRPPLAVGKEWRSEYVTRNTKTGGAWKDSVAAKVVAQEMVTTPAGTFATFKIESRRHEISATDPSRSWEYENVGWYAPEINHWVRRTLLTKAQKRTSASTSEELIAYGRRQ
jgi:hypothetical protein